MPSPQQRRRSRTAIHKNQGVDHPDLGEVMKSRISTVCTAFSFSLGVILLASCGGGSSSGDTGSTATAAGIFKDANTSGLSYVSGSQTGTTGADGSFTYEVGQPVSFSVGGVTIGTATGQSVVTPVDLVPGAGSSSTQVQNIVRFLMMLDSDGDPSNGIRISTATRAIAASWSPVDFSTTDLPAALVSIISDAASADGTPHALPDSASARSHLESTLLCTRAGAFRGTFTGTDTGTFGFLVDAKTGLLSGVAYSNTDQILLTLAGTAAVAFDRTGAFVSGNTSTGATFGGAFTSPDNVAGNWANSPDSGTFAGGRIGGAADAAFRFTGSYTGGDSGLYSFDVDSADNITGVAYSVPDDQLYTLSGTVTGTTVSATSSGGASISGTLDKTTGSLSGTWADSTNGTSGSYTGSGCKLN